MSRPGSKSGDDDEWSLPLLRQMHAKIYVLDILHGRLGHCQSSCWLKDELRCMIIFWHQI